QRKPEPRDKRSGRVSSCHYAVIFLAVRPFPAVLPFLPSSLESTEPETAARCGCVHPAYVRTRASRRFATRNRGTLRRLDEQRLRETRGRVTQSVPAEVPDRGTGSRASRMLDRSASDC